MTLAESTEGTKPKRASAASPRRTIKAIIPAQDFERIFTAAKKSSYAKAGCGSVKAHYALKACNEGIAEWWKRVNGNAPGMCHYDTVFIKASYASASRNRLPEDKLRACFIPHAPYTAADAHRLLSDMVREAFANDRA